MEAYLKKVKEQLICNATKKYKDNYITYDYTNKQVGDNLYFFKKCKELELSPYKALLYFSCYLEDQFDFK